MKKRILSIIVVVMMIFTMIPQPAFAGETTAEQAYKYVGKTVYDGVSKSPVFGVEWLVIGLARSDYGDCSEMFEEYYESVVQELKNCDGVLHKKKYTEYSRTIIGIKAIGRNPQNIAGYDIVSKLLETENVCWQGLNGPIWALIALDTGDYTFEGITSAEYEIIKKEYINKILESEKDGGGWSLNSSETKADTDITAMAVTALAPYYNYQSDIKKAVDRAVIWMSENQNDDGTYSSWGTRNSESCSQVIVALSSLGINPDTDERFIKNGKSVVDGLLSFYSDRQFKHTETGKVNAMATEQGYYALTAYFRMINNKTSLYDMSDRGGFVAVQNLSKAKITSVKSTKKQTVTVKFNKVKTAKGYQIYYSTKKSMASAKKITTSALSKNVTKLKSGKKYYFKVRAYKTVDGNKVYGKWSDIKSIKVK